MSDAIVKSAAETGGVVKYKPGKKGGDGFKDDVKETGKFTAALIAVRMAGNAAADAGIKKTPLVEGGLGLLAMLGGKRRGALAIGGKAALADATIRLADGLYNGGKATLFGGDSKPEPQRVTVTEKK